MEEILFLLSRRTIDIEAELCHERSAASTSKDNTHCRSRLGCQVHLTKELDGMVAKLPSATRNMYVDGAKARTH